MDTIHEEDWSDLENDFPVWVDTFDKKGQPGNFTMNSIQGRNTQIVYEKNANDNFFNLQQSQQLLDSGTSEILT